MRSGSRRRASAAGGLSGAAGVLVRQELQADCFAGFWAHHAQARHDWLEPGDIEAALNTSSAIGDDRLQRQAQGTVLPDAFTHGTSVQRVRWFRTRFYNWRSGPLRYLRSEPAVTLRASLLRRFS